MAGNFSLLEHTADTGIIARGHSQKEAYEQAALGLVSIITDIDRVQDVLSREIQIGSTDKESLLVDFLNELIYLFETQHLLFNRFDIIEIDNIHLKTVAYGEKFDKGRHRVHHNVKAATYHDVMVQQSDSMWELRIILDI